MEGISRSWENRYEILEKMDNFQAFPLSEKINIEQYKAKDKLLRQMVILKKVDLNEDTALKSLARYLWHYEISLNQRATNNSRGKTLLKLIDAQRE